MERERGSRVALFLIEVPVEIVGISVLQEKVWISFNVNNNL